jgi:hypothetical protein
VQCAAVALAGLTALISIEETLKLKSGETILIQGGAGGVAGSPSGSPSTSARASSPPRARRTTIREARSAPTR